MIQISQDIKLLVEQIEKSQWSFKPDFYSIRNLPILTREDLRKTPMSDDIGTSKTSGSTGEPVTIGKSYRDLIWYQAATIRELRWLGWDVSKNIAIIKAGSKEEVLDGWGIPEIIEPFQGKRWINNLLPITQLQSWLQEVNPHYIHTLPSVFRQLDTKKISNFIDWKGTGELRANCYSSEECGIIAIKCPDNSEVYHVMENQLVEVDSSGSLIITTRSNKYIRRYKHGDHIELGVCDCGRTLQTIKKIHGRVRNMMILPNGDKKWPQIGSLEYESLGIKRFKMVQKTPRQFELSVISKTTDRTGEIINVVKKWIGFECDVTIKYVQSFSEYKFEEFVCEIPKL